MRVSFTFTLCCLGFCLIAGESHAVDRQRRISQYAHTAWRLQDGFVSGTPNAITQTKDGYIWIGTQNALVRFDGVRFVPWITASGATLFASGILSLAPADDGGLWIGTGKGLTYSGGGKLVSYLPGGRINQIFLDDKRRVWITRSRTQDSNGPLCQVEEDRLKCYGVSEGLPPRNAGALAGDAQGQLWIGSTDSLIRWSNGTGHTDSLPALQSAHYLSGIESLAVGRDDSVWIGIDRFGAGLGLQHLIDGVISTFHTPSFDGSLHKVSTLFIDRNDVLWVGTIDEGIFRVDQDKVDHFGSADGLSGDAVTCFTQDHEGNIWVTTTKGIDSFRDLPVANFSKQQALSSDEAASITATPDGALWIGNLDSLDILRDGNVSSVRQAQGLPGQQVTSLFVDHANVLWVGVDNGLYRFVNGRFFPVTGNDGRPLGIIESLAEDSRHNIWANATREPASRALQIADGKVQREWTGGEKVGVIFSGPGGDPWISIVPGTLAPFGDGRMTPKYALDHKEDFGRLFSPFLDEGGVIWTSSRNGEVAFKDGTFHILSEASGLPCNWIYTSLMDRIGSLWLYAHCGLIQIESAEIKRWLSDPDSKVAVRTFDVYSGAQPSLATFKPRATLSPDGRLWFVNDNLVQMIDPMRLDLNPIPPPVHVEQLIVAERVYPYADNLVLPANTKDIQIDYTALSFVAPQRVRFRVQLVGHDKQWKDVDTRRSAFYTNLGPGRYQFRVSACNNAGVWNDVGATLGFLIPPTWYQTLWFQFLCGFAVLLAVYALYLIRLRQLSARLRMRLDERLEERTRIARDLHDTLLQTIQGSKLIADVAGDNVVDPAKTKHALKTLSEWLGRAALEGRTALESLRATAVTDLGTALRSTIENYKAASEIQFGLSVQNVGTEINPVMKEEVYWIAYEAIRNATNHSQASRVEVELAIEEDLRLRVKDDGCGIADSILLEGKLGHFGLKGMRERAAHIGATLTISSSSQLGTTVALFVPGKNLFSPFRKVEVKRHSALGQGLARICRTERRKAVRDGSRH